MKLWNRFQCWRLTRRLRLLQERVTYVVAKYAPWYPEDGPDEIVRTICDDAALFGDESYEMRQVLGEIAVTRSRLANYQRAVPTARMLRP